MKTTKETAMRALAKAQAAPRCLARNRSGKPCQRAVTKNKKRCHMHGGAPGSGAPKGNKNRLVHGHYTAAAMERRRLLNALLRNARDLI